MVVRFVEVVVLCVVVSPLVLLAVIAYFTWGWYSTVWTPRHEVDNALLAISGVGGVLWSGAVITYSIHQRYTPALRTAVQLIQFAFLASLAGLLGQGATLRTAFYLLGCFYAVSALLSFGLRALKPHLEDKMTRQLDKEMGKDAKGAQQSAQQVLFKFLERIAHGAWYFVLVAVECLATVILARQDVLAWMCLVTFVVSLFLILPELFDVGESKGDKTPPS